MNKIIVIENNAAKRKNITEVLELADYKVQVACNGKEGIEFTRNSNPDLILSAIDLPDLDGYGVLCALANISEVAGTPFVLMTDKNDKADFRKAMDLGADDFLIQPFTSDDLLRVVSVRLKKSQLSKKIAKINSVQLNDFMHEVNLIKEAGLIANKQHKKKIRKKEFIFMEGDNPDFLYYILSGKIKVFKTNYLGKEFITEINKEGDFCGYSAMLEGKPHKESSMAIEDSEVALISKNDFYQLLCSDSQVPLIFIRLLTQNLSKAEDKMLKLAYDSARKKVAEALLFICRKYEPLGNHEFSFPVHRENLSAIAGLSPESVSRNLTDFREEGLIETYNRTIRIKDFERLENMKW